MMNKKFLSVIILFCFIHEFHTIEAQECGKRKIVVCDRIFGGEIAEEAEWPWNVAFVHRQAEKFFCGGSLISENHVLSAAHCFQSKNVREILSPFLVEAQLGKFNLSIENETGSETSSVWEIVIHPDWKFDHHKYDADLAVVVLERKVTFTDYIRPICLPTQSHNVVTGTGTVVGWGKSETSDATSAIVPSKLEVPAIEPATCYTTFYQLARYSSPRVFCGGFENLEKAPCLGDSGSGFYFYHQDEAFWEIRGIVSGSLIADAHGCNINKFSLFTNVAQFADWITKKTTETMTVDWKFVEFRCVEWGLDDSTYCSTALDGPMTRNSKIHTNFSAHDSKNSSINVTLLVINFSMSTHVLSGIGEEFRNLRELMVYGDSIKFMQRQSFANMTQLDSLQIRETSVEFLPEDLLADLSSPTVFIIALCRQLKRLPEKFFMNQRKLKTLILSENGLTIIQKD